MNPRFCAQNVPFALQMAFTIIIFYSSFIPSANAEPPAENNGAENNGAENNGPVTVPVGTPIGGSLTRGDVMPKRGAGFSLISVTRERRTRFGVPELIALVKEGAFRVHKKYRRSVLRIGDLSERRGGPVEHHGSHQNGTDVDLLFYLKNKNGSHATTEDFVPIDPNGFSTSPPMKYLFDDARNWALVSHLLTSNKAEVQWIFTADHIKKRLLDYARAHGASKQLISKASQVIHQPSGKPHVDHFHVRIYCPARYTPQCKNIGPVWAWVK